MLPALRVCVSFHHDPDRVYVFFVFVSFLFLFFFVCLFVVLLLLLLFQFVCNLQLYCDITCLC